MRTACQAWLPRARISGCTGGRRDEPLLPGCSTSPCSAVFTPPSFPLPSFLLLSCVSTHVHMSGGHGWCACVHTCLWRLEGVGCLQSPPTFPNVYCLCYWCVYERWGGSENNFWESFLSSYHGFWGRTQVIRLGWQAPLPDEPSRWPSALFVEFIALGVH